MGKKARRKQNAKASQRSKEKGGGNSRTTSFASDAPAQRHDDKQRGGNNNNNTAKTLHGMYKYCTQAVMDWGISTYNNTSSTTQAAVKKDGGERRGSSNSTNRTSRNAPKIAQSAPTTTLSVVLFQCLGTLAKQRVCMPDDILAHLRTAIDYRKRAGAYYRAIPTASQQDHERHAWLIRQLERLEERFSVLAQQENSSTSKQRRTSSSTAAGDEHIRNDDAAHEQFGFHLLSLSDDDDDDEAEEAEADSARSKVPHRASSKPLPTEEELIKEEQTFAISLVLVEIAETRTDLKQLWKDWAYNQETTKDNSSDSDAASADLLAVTACTEYTLSALSKFLGQTSMEYSAFAKLNLQALGDSTLTHQEVPNDLQVGECVTIRNLSKRPDFNGEHGRITREPIEGRLGVQLFAKDPRSAATGKESRQLSIKPENLVRSDNPYLRLMQIDKALESFSFDTCPSPPNRRFQAPVTEEMIAAHIALATHYDKFEYTLENEDYVGFLHLMAQYVLPLWISFARYSPNAGAADSILTAYLRDFAETRQVTFQLALAIMVAIDVAFAAAEANPACADHARDLYVRKLGQIYDGATYTRAIELMDQNNLRSDAFYSHYELARQYQHGFSEMCAFFPWQSGEMLHSGLRMHLVCGSGLPYQFVQEYTTVLHMYWMLRSQGYLARLPEIENSVVRMYRQQVWFRGGVPQKGSEAYLKSWQLAVGGVNLRGARLLGGQSTGRSLGPTRAAEKDMKMTGLHVTEISKLQEILQWKSMPFSNRAACYSQIQEIAKDEYHSVFTAPLMSASTKLSFLYGSFGQKFVGIARSGGERMVTNFHSLTRELADTNIVCFWGLSLADDRALNPQEKEVGLSMLAKSFKDGFQEDVQASNGEGVPTLNFSPNNHSVDPSRARMQVISERRRTTDLLQPGLFGSMRSSPLTHGFCLLVSLV